MSWIKFSFLLKMNLWKSREVFLFILVVGSILYVRYYIESTPSFFKIRFITNSVVPGYFVFTEGCRIPYMDPFDDSVKKYFYKRSHLRCSNKIPLVESNQTSIYIVPEALKFYYAKEIDHLTCCYTAFWRKKVPIGIVDYAADNKTEWGFHIFKLTWTENDKMFFFNFWFQIFEQLHSVCRFGKYLRWIHKSNMQIGWCWSV